MKITAAPAVDGNPGSSITAVPAVVGTPARHLQLLLLLQMNWGGVRCGEGALRINRLCILIKTRGEICIQFWELPF